MAAESKTGKRPSLLSVALSDGIPKRSFIAGLLVGAILNLLNQGDALFAGEPLNWWKIALTFVVPYLVTTYGAVSARMQTIRRAAEDASE